MSWIKCSDRLPEEMGYYIIYASHSSPEWGELKRLVAKAWFAPDDRTWGGIAPPWVDRVTHWMPLPSPPREEET